MFGAPRVTVPGMRIGIAQRKAEQLNGEAFG